MSTTTVLQQTKTETIEESRLGEFQEKGDQMFCSTITNSPNNSKSTKLSRQNSIHQLFNAYICDRNWLFLPNVITWLKTSKLQDCIENILNNTKSVLFTCVVYFALLLKLKNFTSEFVKNGIKSFSNKSNCASVQQDCSEKQTQVVDTVDIKGSCDAKDIIKDKLLALRNVAKPVISPKTLLFKNLVLRSSLYLIIMCVHLQLVIMFFALYSSTVPNGLIFLLSMLACVIVVASIVMPHNYRRRKKSKVNRQSDSSSDSSKSESSDNEVKVDEKIHKTEAKECSSSE